MKRNLCCVAVMAIVAACGGSTTNSSTADGGPSGEQEAGVDTGSPIDSGTGTTKDSGGGVKDSAPEAEAGLDHGAPSTTYPAFTPSFAKLQNNGGLVMAHPIIVAVTWAADSSESSFQSFADNIGATAYWKAASSEYGVGPAVSGPTNHVSMTGAAPTQVLDSDLQNWVTTNAGITAGWPAPTDNTVYAFFLPPGALLYMQNMTGAGNDACSQGVGGYHSQVTVGSVTTSYAVTPSCTFGGTNTAAQQTTMSMSHELLESSTDPQPQGTMPGWVGFDQDHFAFDWFLEFSDENGDACEAYKDSFFEDKETTPPFDFWVQRTWSNKMGPLGHDPCQIGDEPYFNVAILNLTEVTVTLPAGFNGPGSPAQNIQVLGVHAPIGKSTTVELGLYSDAPTAPFTVTWGQGSPFLPTPPTYLNATIDVATGVNGNKAYATVTPNAAGKLAAELLWFRSTLNGVTHTMPVVVSSFESD
jgi:hypothetical protein